MSICMGDEFDSYDSTNETKNAFTVRVRVRFRIH